MYAILLTPKLAGAAIIACHPKATRLYGGRGAFLSAFGVEVLLSIAYAPIMMVQQTQAVLRTALGRPMDWRSQHRGANSYPPRDLLRFHWLETLLGVILTLGLLSGLVSLWLLPIAASLLLAVPLSALSAVPVAVGLPRFLSMHTPVTLREPGIVTAARWNRMQVERYLQSADLPAE
jgi:membrane glycosyltransferase